MPSELWEIVRADELKVGDVIKDDADLETLVIGEIRQSALRVYYKHRGGKSEYSMANSVEVFRRYPGHHPDVLMRVIQNMHSEIRGWNEVGDYPTPTDSIDKYIAEAESEIAKERESNG